MHIVSLYIPASIPRVPGHFEKQPHQRRPPGAQGRAPLLLHQGSSKLLRLLGEECGGGALSAQLLKSRLKTFLLNPGDHGLLYLEGR